MQCSLFEMTTVSNNQGPLSVIIGVSGKFILYIQFLLWFVFIVVTVTLVIIVLTVMIVIIGIVCLKHTKIKTVQKSNIINLKQHIIMSVLYITDKLSVESPQVTVNKTSPVSNEVIEEWSS